MINYQALDGYRPVLQGDSAQLDDPYGIMPLTNFQGGNIKDITFVPADVLTVRLEYKYSPTGGLAGMDAADSQVFQMKVDDVERDGDGAVTSAKPFSATWGLPHYDETTGSNPTLEGFRIVLDPSPLNEFLIDRDLAKKAMNGGLTAEEIQAALEKDKFSVNTNNPEKPVYHWQTIPGEKPPESYEKYPINGNYSNRYSDDYNDAWNKARTITDKAEYTARAFQKDAEDVKQGANPLTAPQLTLELTADQCKAALNSDKGLTVTVYYRRNAGFYYVGHWVPKSSLSKTDQDHYTNTEEFSAYNKQGVAPFDSGHLLVYLERKQGRVGALTNARPNPTILKAFTSKAVNQKTIEADTRVDILYETADRYGLIFQVEGTYIPRQYVNKGYTVTFTKTDENANSGMTVTDSSGNPVTGGYAEYKNPLRQGYKFAGWKYEVRSDVAVDGTNVVEENGKKYRVIKVDDQWEITRQVVDEAVVIQDSDSGDAKMIYLYPVWTPAKANVRVVFWTEDLGGGANDVQVTINENESSNAPYLQNLEELKNSGKDYRNGSPDKVDQNTSFSNVGSFTFMAPPTPSWTCP